MLLVILAVFALLFTDVGCFKWGWVLLACGYWLVSIIYCENCEVWKGANK